MSIVKQNLLAREKSNVTVFLGETMTRKSVADKCIWNYLSWDEGMKWSLANIYRLRIFTGNKYLWIRPQSLKKVQSIWVVGTSNKSTLHKRFLHWNKILKKNRVVTGKTSLFGVGPFCTHHSIGLDMSFWYGSFVWKWYIFNLSAFN